MDGPTEDYLSPDHPLQVGLPGHDRRTFAGSRLAAVGGGRLRSPGGRRSRLTGPGPRRTWLRAGRARHCGPAGRRRDDGPTPSWVSGTGPRRRRAPCARFPGLLTKTGGPRGPWFAVAAARVGGRWRLKGRPTARCGATRPMLAAAVAGCSGSPSTNWLSDGFAARRPSTRRRRLGRLGACRRIAAWTRPRAWPAPRSGPDHGGPGPHDHAGSGAGRPFARAGLSGPLTLALS